MSLPVLAAIMDVPLTRRQREVLDLMAERADLPDGELVYERGEGWLGLERVAPRTVFALLRHAAISLKQGSGPVGKGVERYRINATGLALVTVCDG